MATFSLPELPYAYDALEPHIDEQTMRIHHGKHHQGYTNKLNAALEGVDMGENTSIEAILADLGSLPEDKQIAVRNNGGGYFNHGVFWTIMSPNGGGKPKGDLAKAIDEAFGSFDAFKEEFKTAAGGQFGSGWAWLAVDAEGKLVVIKRQNQDAPVMDGHYPILGIDVWEHAYYLKYQNKRPDYVEAFFNLINWDEADRRYRQAV